MKKNKGVIEIIQDNDKCLYYKMLLVNKHKYKKQINIIKILGGKHNVLTLREQNNENKYCIINFDKTKQSMSKNGYQYIVTHDDQIIEANWIPFRSDNE